MKLPFDLGVKLFFRLLLPGFFLTLGLLPAEHSLVDWAKWPIRIEYILLLSITLTGWLIVILDMPIYMLFEGRRFWPNFLSKIFVNREKGRLMEIQENIAKLKNSQPQKYLEASVEIRKFPIDSSGLFEARFPTRLGNLLTAYETYPNSRYGMNGVFYWYRIWLKLDKDTKEDIDNRSALADGAVYTSLSLYIAAFLWFIYSLISALHISTIKYSPNNLFSWLLSLAFLLSGYGIYRSSVYVHAQFGEVFKSVFDVYGKDVDVSKAVEEVAILTRRSSQLKMSRTQQLNIAWRYLHNYRIKCTDCGKVLPPPDARNHFCTVPTVAELESVKSTSRAMIKNYSDEE